MKLNNYPIWKIFNCIIILTMQAFLNLSVIILLFIAGTAHARNVPGTNLEEKRFELKITKKLKPSMTTEQIFAEIVQLNGYIGGYPPRFASEEERESIYRRWLELVSDAEFFASLSKDEETLYILSELYRQGHNIDVGGSPKHASSNIELCLAKYPQSVRCNFSAVYFFLSVGPEDLDKAEASL